MFKNAGYNIKNCYVATIDNKYVRNGEIEPKKLFKLNLVTDEVILRTKDVLKNLAQIKNMKIEPKCKIGENCSKFFKCRYNFHCWCDVPDYSTFNVFDFEKAVEIFQDYGTADLEKLPIELLKNSFKYEEIMCFLNKTTLVQPEKITEFLKNIKYPIYFLDFETINCAIPLFKNSRPYQQIPFQFSLHIKKTPEAPLEHIEFLHKSKTDPRESLIEKLILSCGEIGSIVTYNAQFEKMIIKDLMRDFPQYQKQLENINERMVDLLAPFKKRMIYHHTQNDSASLKKTLLAFTDINYDDLKIQDGGDASSQYLGFMQGKIKHLEELFGNLSKYCHLDTLAMVELLNVLYNNS